MNAKNKIQLVWAVALLGIGAIVIVSTVVYNSAQVAQWGYVESSYVPLGIFITLAGFCVLITWTYGMLIASEGNSPSDEQRVDAHQPLGGPGAADGLN